MKSTKQSVSFSSSKSISFMARGKGGFLNPFPSKRSLLPPLWFTAPWDKRVRKFSARTGKNSGKQKPVEPKARPLSILHKSVSMFQRIPSVPEPSQRWLFLGKALPGTPGRVTLWTWGTFWGFSFSDSSWEPEERLQGNGLLFDFCMIKKWRIFKWWGIND